MNQSGVRLVTGGLPALESAFLSRLTSIRTADPFSPIDVVVGGVLQRPYLQRLIADSSPGLLNVRFSTLGELGIQLGERSVIDAGRRPHSSDGGARVRRRGRPRDAGLLRPSCAHPWFRGSDTSARGRAATGGRLARSTRATRTYYGRVRLEGREPRGSLPTLPRRAGRPLRRRQTRSPSPTHSAFDGAELLVYGVWRLGAHGRRLLERLADRVPVDVSSSRPSAATPTSRTVELREWLSTLGASETTPDPVAAEPTALAPPPGHPVRPRDPSRPGRHGATRLRSRPTLGGTGGSTDVPRLGARRNPVPGDGDRLPRRGHLPSRGRGRVHRGRDSPSTSTTARRSPSGRSAGASSR